MVGVPHMMNSSVSSLLGGDKMSSGSAMGMSSHSHGGGGAGGMDFSAQQALVTIFDADGNDVTPKPLMSIQRPLRGGAGANSATPENSTPTSEMSESATTRKRKESYRGPASLSGSEGTVTPERLVDDMMIENENMNMDGAAAMGAQPVKVVIERSAQASSKSILGVGADEDELDKKVYLSLEETDTFTLLHMPSRCVHAESSESSVVASANARYASMVELGSGSGSEGVLTANEAQTLNHTMKSREVQVNAMKENSVGSQVTLWDISDASNSAQSLSSESSKTAQSISGSFGAAAVGGVREADDANAATEANTHLHSPPLSQIPGLYRALRIVERAVTQNTYNTHLLTYRNYKPRGITSSSVVPSFNTSNKKFTAHPFSEGMSNNNNIDMSEASSPAGGASNALANSSSPTADATTTASSTTATITAPALETSSSSPTSKDLLDSSAPSSTAAAVAASSPTSKELLDSSTTLNAAAGETPTQSTTLLTPIQSGIAAAAAAAAQNGSSPNTTTTPSSSFPPSLQHLWSFTCDLTRGRNISSMCWNKYKRDLLVVGYGQFQFGETSQIGGALSNTTTSNNNGGGATGVATGRGLGAMTNSNMAANNMTTTTNIAGATASTNNAMNGVVNTNNKQVTNSAPQGGLIAFWSLKNPEYPEWTFHTPSSITALDFSAIHPNLLAVGFYDGSVAIYDVRSPEPNPKPVLESTWSSNHNSGKHSDPVWGLQWGDSNSERGETLVSISTDGRVTQWSIKKGLEHMDLMRLKRTSRSTTTTSSSSSGNNEADSENNNEKKSSSNNNSTKEAFISRRSSGMCLDFSQRDSSMYIAGTEDGTIHKYVTSLTPYFTSKATQFIIN